MKIFLLVFALFTTVATAGSPFLPMDNRPFTAPKYADWANRPAPASARQVTIRFTIGWLQPVSPLEPNFIRAQNGQAYLVIQPVAGQPGYYWVR